MKPYELTETQRQDLIEEAEITSIREVVDNTEKEAQKNLLKWLKEPCSDYHSFTQHRKDCLRCWQLLLKEFEIGEK